MRLYEVIDPTDIRNPIPKQERRNIALVYHGTSGVYVPSIEQFGFDPTKLPYSMDDVQKINRTYERSGWHGISGNGYPVTRGFTAGSDNGYVRRKPISFSYHYEYARSYARNRGGETVNHVVVAIEEFRKFVHDKGTREAHIDYLQRRIQQLPVPVADQTPYPGYLSACVDDHLVASHLQKLLPILEKYAQIRAQHQGVVYAVRARPKYFSERPGPGDIDVRSVRIIPPDFIFARIDFPNGIERVDFTSSDLEESPYRPS